MKTTGELSKTLHVSRFTLVSAAKKGLISAKQSGGTWLIDEEAPEFRAWQERYVPRSGERPNRQRITEGLASIGASWATRDEKFISANDPAGAKPTYHVHPDAKEPRQESILRFSTLKDVDGYIQARMRSGAAESPAEAIAIMDAYWMSQQ